MQSIAAVIACEHKGRAIDVQLDSLIENQNKFQIGNRKLCLKFFKTSMKSTCLSGSRNKTVLMSKEAKLHPIPNFILRVKQKAAKAWTLQGEVQIKTYNNVFYRMCVWYLHINNEQSSVCLDVYLLG